MNKRALNLLTGEVAYVILLVLAIALTFALIYEHTNNAGVWQDYYAKEIARVIDASKPGDNVTFNVQQGTIIAQRNGLSLTSGTLFTFNSANHQVCILLGKGQPTCYSYFNDVVVLTSSQPIEFAAPENVLHFSVVSPSKGGTA